jgi:hypothetical protein
MRHDGGFGLLVGCYFSCCVQCVYQWKCGVETWSVFLIRDHHCTKQENGDLVVESRELDSHQAGSKRSTHDACQDVVFSVVFERWIAHLSPPANLGIGS